MAPDGRDGPSGATSHVRTDGSTSAPSPFSLKPEWTGPCVRADPVDVNLGHSPDAFVRAAYCQITGKTAPADLVELWAERLKREVHVRRIDVVRWLCQASGRACASSYGDPWRSQPELVGAPLRTSKRDVGAVFMFFFDCPGRTNCGMDWANTHALGMSEPHPLYSTNGGNGFYTPTNQGFWRRELLEAEYAGLSFLALNVYGPELGDAAKVAPLTRALAEVGRMRIALFDDTWAWGQSWFGDFWKNRPDLANTDDAAKRLYDAKWKPFFQQVDRRYWYRFKNRPLIFFYNAGTLNPRNRSAAVLAKMKSRFEREFREEPFLVVDTAFFEDAAMPQVADARFIWRTFHLPQQRSRSTLHGHIIDHAMVKWDAVGRDRPGHTASPNDFLIKQSDLLKKVLADSRDAELLLLATFNDLGEGTGINRNYDYYAGGRWLEPDHFMRLIRASQSSR